MKNWFSLLIFIFLITSCAWAISITVTGSWNEIIDSADLQGPAGSDLISSCESASNQIDIDITEVTGSWEVTIRKADTNWDSNLSLYAKRTSDGTAGTINGGTTYQEISDIDQSFFWSDSGVDTYNIFIQLKVSGLSVQIPPDNYTTTVYYTITENI
jgi:hypothetical protein